MEIIDNVNKTLKEDLTTEIHKGSKVSIAAACFSIYAFAELKKELKNVDELRFIFTSPTFIKEKAKREKREFYIPRQEREKNLFGSEFEVKLRNEMTQKAIAKECAEWIRKKAVFKSNVTNENMMGFINVDDKNYMPLSGFTTVDLGCERGNNAYYIVQKSEAPMSTAYLQLFEQIWNDASKLQEVTDEVIENITTVYNENSPDYLYFVTLYNIFNEFLEDVSEDVLPNEATGFKESKIWGMLYNFQKDAALAIINKLEKYNGCILADSVGLGKTFTALSVIKYYENRNKSVLVLCPKKLANNWNTYKYNYINNPIAADRMRYDVLFHTDLSRESGNSNGMDLDMVNWENYDLVVIDESHNFRNGGKISGEDEKENRYLKLLNKVTDKYRQEIKSGTVAELPDELKTMAEGIHMLIQSVYDDSILQDMFTDGHETKVKDNPLNDNFAKKEFQALWQEINHKYAYTVEFDSNELIKKAIDHIDEKLFVSELQYTTTIGRQKAEMNEYEVERADSFTGEKTRTQILKHADTSQIKYDLIGKVAEGTTLTRKTVSAILQGIRADKLYMFKNNPEEFITKVIRLINEQKATMIVEHISYDTIEGEYDSTIFTAEKNTQSFDKAFLAKKAIQDYVFTDGSAEKSIERKFAEDLDAAAEVCVYAKLPRTFQIPTPVGNYSPDWAIAFYEGTVKHIFFVAETKGTMETLNLRPIEQAKISCAKKLFNEMSNSKVVYHDVDSYQSLLNIMNDPSLDKKVCE